jgi:anti-sigma factor RsiW
MCEERERLIGYVYDECDETERRAIEAHLEQCAGCRREINGFRRVRQDLLAWDVPDHDSVWRPFAPPRTTAWWQEVPAWAMAAAAVAIFAVGAGGGALTHALVPHDPVSRVADASAAQTGPQVTPADLEAFEARMIGMVRSELSDRTPETAAFERVSMTPQERADFEAEIMRRVVALQTETSNRHDATWGVLADEFSRQTMRVNKLGEQVETLGQLVNLQGSVR